MGSKISANLNNPAIDLASHTSWILKGRNDLFPQPAKHPISELLGEEVDNQLTLVTDDGEVYEHNQSLKINNGKIQISKPSDWKDSADSFHIIFKNKHNSWNFFRVKITTTYPSFFLFNPPTNIYFLQRRRYKRVPVPVGTKAVFQVAGQDIDSAHVQDISEGGMLIGINSAKEKYHTNSIINEIFITIPPKTKKSQTDVFRRIIPVINKGKIVRTFYDQARSISCYAISFLFKDDNPRREVSEFISYLKNTRNYPHLFQDKT